ncbi:MAG TPA: VanZ family protein [Steroidobacteraceae bacterium]|nr:VanZ family protein [Steroidobacteraceae bacterium]
MTLPLRFRRTWVVIGWALVALAIYGSLTGNAVVTHSSINDKVMHAGTYATLSLWFAGIYPRSRYLLIALGLFSLGISMELLQGVMREGRMKDVHDVMANTLGIGIGLAVATWWLGGWAQRLERLLTPKAEM